MAEALRPSLEKNERSRPNDILVAEQLGIQMLSGIPNLLMIGQMDFTDAQSPDIEKAWDTMQGPYKALMDYYEYFTEVQPPFISYDAYHTSWRDMQPYASIKGALANKEHTIDRLFGHRDAQYHRSEFNEQAKKLLSIIASDFKLPNTLLHPDLTTEQRAEILSQQTGPDLFGMRFLPVYRSLFSSRSRESDDALEKLAQTEVLWNPNDSLNRIVFLKNGRPYYIGSTGSARDLEELLDDTVLVTGVQQTAGKPTPQIPVFDVDGTLRMGEYGDALTKQAVTLLSQLAKRNMPYILWSRAEQGWINQVVRDIAQETNGSPQKSLYFNEYSWPFQTIREKGDNFTFTPHSKDDIAQQVKFALSKLGVSAEKAGFGDKKHLVNVISQFIEATNPKTGKSDFEYALQGKCPWFIPLSFPGDMLESDVACALLENGVLFDDRTSTIPPAHFLGFNFVHVPSLKSLSKAAEFILGK